IGEGSELLPSGEHTGEGGPLGDARLGHETPGFAKVAAIGPGNDKVEIPAAQAAHGPSQDIQPLLEIDAAEKKQDRAVADLRIAGAKTSPGRKVRIIRRIQTVG